MAREGGCRRGFLNCIIGGIFNYGGRTNGDMAK
jgi:hypothetical protein